MRWGWIMTNVATVAGLGRRKTAPRGSLIPDQVRRVLAEAAAHDPAAGLALRLAAVTGARRGELAALRWDDVEGDHLTIDSSLATAMEAMGSPFTSAARLTWSLKVDGAQTGSCCFPQIQQVANRPARRLRRPQGHRGGGPLRVALGAVHRPAHLGWAAPLVPAGKGAYLPNPGPLLPDRRHKPVGM
jgi:hypothetical protein